MEEPAGGCQLPSATIFGQVLEPPICRVEMTLTTSLVFQNTKAQG